MSATTLVSVLCLAVLGPPTAANAGEAVDKPPSGPAPRPFVQHAFALTGIWPPNDRGARMAIGVDLEAGGVWQPRRLLRLSVSGSLAQGGITRAAGRGFDGAMTDVSGKLRVGLSGGRWWGYAIVRAGMTIATEDGGDYFALDAGATAGAGLGFLFHMDDRLSVGGEALANVTWEPPRDAFLRVTGGVLMFQIRFGGKPTTQ